MWTVVPAASLVPVLWRNGQGVTRDVVTVLAADGSLDWQASIADLAAETGFSDFTGYDRVFTPLSEGVALAFGGGPFVECPVLVPVPFAGERPARCRVPHPAQAFNAIARRPRAVAVNVLRLQAGEAVPAGGGTTVLHCWQGTVQAGATQLHPRDSAHGTGDARAVTDAVVIRVAVP